MGADLYVGNELALAGSPYPTNWLVTHIVLAFTLIGLAGWATRIAWRPLHRRWITRLSALMTVLAAVGATLAGFLYLWAGQSNNSLYAMEGLAGLVVLGGIFLLIWGSIPIGIRKG